MGLDFIGNEKRTANIMKISNSQLKQEKENKNKINKLRISSLNYSYKRVLTAILHPTLRYFDILHFPI